jgi:hypothetical protein
MALFIMKNNQQYGPFEESVVAGWIMSGACSPDDMAWKPGMPSWQPLRYISLLEAKSPKKSGGWAFLNLVGLLITMSSTLAAIGGYWYISQHKITGYATQLGWQDSSYNTANMMFILGILGVVVGIGMIIVGFIMKAQR